MRIALVRRKIDSLGGGAERYAARLARRLCADGHQVSLICQHVEDALCAEDLAIIRVARVRTPHWTKSTAFAQMAGEICRAHEFDLVFGLSSLPCANLIRVSEGVHRHYLEVRYGSGWLASLQQMNPRHRALMHLEDEVFSSSCERRFIVQCQVDRFLLHSHFQIPDDRIVALSNGVDTELFRPQSTADAPGAQLLFAAASNFRRKGLPELIQALAILRDSSAHLYVAGPHNSAYQRLAREWRVDHRVTFLGLRNDMHELYACSDLVIAPSIYEPFPNVVLESIASGTPVVTTISNGAAELIQHKQNGFLIGQPQPRAIAESIEEYLALNERARHKMRDACRRTAIEHSWDSHFAQLSSVINGWPAQGSPVAGVRIVRGNPLT